MGRQAPSHVRSMRQSEVETRNVLQHLLMLTLFREFQTKTIVEELVVRSEKSINETLQRSDVKAQGLVQDSEKALEDFVRKCVSDSEARLERQLAESEARTKKYLAELIQKLSAQPGAK